MFPIIFLLLMALFDTWCVLTHRKLSKYKAAVGEGYNALKEVLDERLLKTEGIPKNPHTIAILKARELVRSSGKDTRFRLNAERELTAAAKELLKNAPNEKYEARMKELLAYSEALDPLIAAYNDAILAYSAAVKAFPAVLVATMLGHRPPAPYSLD